MNKEEIIPWDWYRIMIGNAPYAFMLEVFLRSAFMYLLLLVVFRLLGKRMAGQLTLTELSVIITFGAIVSVPMQIPERGIATGIVGLLCAVVFQRGLNWITVKYKRADSIVQGKMTIIIMDGVLQLVEMGKAGISREQVFAALRNQEIFNLGSVKRLYFEACGLLNVYKNEPKKEGLSILPVDQQPRDRNGGPVACANCGLVVANGDTDQICSHCHCSNWVAAVA